MKNFTTPQYIFRFPNLYKIGHRKVEIYNMNGTYSEKEIVILPPNYTELDEARFEKLKEDWVKTHGEKIETL
jgi:hypothetical protein